MHSSDDRSENLFARLFTYARARKRLGKWETLPPEKCLGGFLHRALLGA